MVASPSRSQAHRKNVQKSNRSRTPSGVEKSRFDADKHGLCGAVAGSFHLGGWLVGQVASLGLRVEHAQDMQQAARERLALRARLTWDEDRRLEAVILGGQIAQRPAEVLARLRETLQGCQWLITRWAMLAYTAETTGWTPDQKALALNLVGVAAEFREGNDPGTEVDTDGRLMGPALEPAAQARSRVAELFQRIEIVEKLDAVDRQNAEAGLIDDPELRRLRRDEMALQRQLRWALELLQKTSTPPPPGSPEPEPEAEPEPSSPPVPTALPKRSTTRAEKKLNKAEARREARLRKLDKLRS